jgi:hypothetical protein
LFFVSLLLLVVDDGVLNFSNKGDPVKHLGDDGFAEGLSGVPDR